MSKWTMCKIVSTYSKISLERFKPVIIFSGKKKKKEHKIVQIYISRYKEIMKSNITKKEGKAKVIDQIAHTHKNPLTYKEFHHSASSCFSSPFS